MFVTVENSKADVEKNAGKLCSTNPACSSDINTIGDFGKVKDVYVSCEAGQYVTIHDEFTVSA